MKTTQDGYYEDDEIKEPEQNLLQPTTIKKKVSKKTIFICLSLFALALGLRLYFFSVATDPNNPGAGWFGDSYHHWQIGYLTKEIGLHRGFLRVWDLKGMDLFWGLLHPIALASIFTVTGNSSMWMVRAMTSTAGAISVVIIYLLGKRYWNEKVGVAAAVFTACCSVIIFNDATGMVEPLGIPFLLGGIYFWPRKTFLAGILLGIAMMTRSEFWVFSLGLTAAFILFDRAIHTDKKVLLVFGLLLVLIPYMKYLLDYTGNPIYPLYQNIDKNIQGEWQYKEVLDAKDLFGQFAFRIITAITVLCSALVLWFKPRAWQWHLLGLGNWLFVGLTFGFSEYIKSWADYVWVVRFLLYPYTFLCIIFAAILFYYIPTRIKFLNNVVGTLLSSIILIFAIGATQLAWPEIFKYYNPTQPTWENIKVVSKDLIKDYKGGGLLMIEGNPDITYALVHEYGVQGKDLVSQMYDPYFYYEEKGVDPYANWNAVNPLSKDGMTFRDEVLYFLKSNNIKYMITYSDRVRYTKLFELEPGLATPATGTYGNLITYTINTDRL
ncbi:MAG: glycosyltransferase family 39 protein [bacterium]|nr:glycosyltransferase family 39 protein [bacterium]